MKRCSYCGAEYPDDATACVIDGTPFDTPPAQSKSSTFQIDRLWIPYLVLCSITSVIGVLSYLSYWQSMNAMLPTWALDIFRCIVFLRPLSIVAMWWGSRSGVVAYIALSTVSMCVSLIIGHKIALGGIIGAVILIVLVRPRWQQMIWEVQMPVNDKDDA